MATPPRPTGIGQLGLAFLNRLPPVALGTLLYASGTAIAFAVALLRDLVIGRQLGMRASADLLLLATNLPYGMGTALTATLDSAVLPSLARAREERIAATLHQVETGLVWLLLIVCPLVLLPLTGPALRIARQISWETAAITVAAAAAVFVASGLLSFRIRCRLGRAHRFFIAGAMPTLLAAGTLVGLGAAALAHAPWSPMFGCLAGAVIAVALSGPPPWSGLVLRRSHPSSTTLSWLFVRKSLPVTTGAALFAVSNVFVRAVAGIGPTGSVASLEYATRAFNIPNTMVITSAAAVLLPLRVRQQGRSPKAEFLTELRWTLLIMGPLTCALAAVAPIVARVLLGRNATHEMLASITTNTLALAAGLPAMLLGNLRMRADQARQNYATSFFGGLATLITATLTAVLLATTGNWTLFGMANTAGLASLLAVVAKVSTHGSNSRRVRLMALGVMGVGVGATLLGAAMSTTLTWRLAGGLFVATGAGFIMGLLLTAWLRSPRPDLAAPNSPVALRSNA